MSEQPQEQETTAPDVEQLNLLSNNLRLGGLALMTVCMALTFGLALWVGWHRKSPVVQAMQPVFLIMLLVGNIITNSSIVPVGMDDSTTSNPDAACEVFPWLNAIGQTFILSAMFSKLWRVNQIFHSEGFQRKVVTAKEMIWPFLILLSLNVIALGATTLLDPRMWVRVPIDGDQNNTVGQCTYESWVGEAFEYARAFINFSALIILCVQAYRARDIKSEFSEARGVALALFCSLQSVVIIFPTLRLIEESNTDARYFLEVLLELTTSLAMLFFIFGPLIAHHRQFQKRKGNRVSLTDGTRVSGIASSSAASSAAEKLASLDLLDAHQRIVDLEAKVKSLNARISDLMGPECSRA